MRPWGFSSVASQTEIWVSGNRFRHHHRINILPPQYQIVMGLIIVPILMIAYSAIVKRSAGNCRPPGGFTID